MSEEDPKRTTNDASPPNNGNVRRASGLAIGIAVGVAIGIATKHLAFGIGIGVALGLAFSVSGKKRG
ncbi:MAG TPA: hypothetical protein VFI26_06835 [Lysobacter sp.]|nr:hypothetical protein [Lysobacter sp.]